MIEQRNGKCHFTRDFVAKNSMNVTIETLLFFYEQRIEKEKCIEEYKILGCENGFIPRFQRELVWTLEQKQNLIYSIMDGLPIGSFYINRVWELYISLHIA